MNDVFISYSRKDTPIVDRICEAFDRAGIKYFIDRQGIGGGFEFPAVLAENIVNSRLFLFIGSKNAYGSRFTNQEVVYSFNKLPRNSMLPYLIDDEPMPLDLEFIFCSINWRRLDTHPVEPVLVDDILGLLGRTRQTDTLVRQQKVPLSSAPKTALSASSATAPGQPTTPKPAPVPRPAESPKPAPAPAPEPAKSREEQIKEWIDKGLKIYNGNNNSLGLFQYKKGDWEALPYFQKAADAGDDWSMYMAGRLKLKHAETYREQEDAKRELVAAGEKGVVRAWLHLGDQKRYSDFSDEISESAKYYAKGVEMGSDEALTSLISLYGRRNNNSYSADFLKPHFEAIDKVYPFAQALEKLQALVKAGNKRAMYEMGKMLVEGKVVEKNYGVALEMLEPLSKVEYYRKELDVLPLLCKVYTLGGHGANPDFPKAEAIARDCFNSGSKELGRGLMFRIRFEQKDYDKALELYAKLNRPSYDNSLVLAKMYAEGLGVDTDYKYAKKILKEAEEMVGTDRPENPGEASYRIARLYLDGHLKDLFTSPAKSARKYLETSSKLGYPPAAELLATF